MTLSQMIVVGIVLAIIALGSYQYRRQPEPTIVSQAKTGTVYWNDMGMRVEPEVMDILSLRDGQEINEKMFWAISIANLDVAKDRLKESKNARR
jgi:hypothetical protein